MYITAYSKENDVEDKILAVNVGQTVMGEPEFKSVVITDKAVDESSSQMVTQLNELDIDSINEDHVVFVFWFQAEGGETAFQRYVSARKPALNKHGGKEILSCITERNDKWPYDTFELIQFPSQQAMQTMMGDPDYSGSDEVKASSKIFSMGAVAMSKLFSLQTS